MGGGVCGRLPIANMDKSTGRRVRVKTNGGTLNVLSFSVCPSQLLSQLWQKISVFKGQIPEHIKPAWEFAVVTSLFRVGHGVPRVCLHPFVVQKVDVFLQQAINPEADVYANNEGVKISAQFHVSYKNQSPPQTDGRHGCP